jgi:branched-chain amino acid transport system substrate-binding protein
MVWLYRITCLDEDGMKKYAFALAALSAAGLSPAQEVVRIGHVAAMTGPVAHFGKDSENGVRMAIDALNARGATIGGRKVKWELAPEDDGGDPKQATAAAQKLADVRRQRASGAGSGAATGGWRPSPRRPRATR